MSVIIDGTQGITSSGSFYGQTTFTGTYTDGVVVDYTTGLGRISVGASDGLAFYNGGVASTERMRIDSSGNLLVGTTSSPTGTYRLVSSTNGAGAAGGALFVSNQSTVGNEAFSAWHTATSGNNAFCYFGTEATFTTRGSITYNRGGGLTAYNTTSDYRAKTVNGPVKSALIKVLALKPSTGRMNGAEYDIDFFVAHELQEIVPSAVTGEKDAVNEDGSPAYQMVDKSALIPLLTAAIQELKAEVDSLKLQLEVK